MFSQTPVHYEKLLSIVIISRNEEENIARSIESAIKATQNIENPEIILVDSASTDRTVEIAMKYPIRILQLHPSWQLSPSAGCYIGFLNSTGKYLQVIGGDMILDEKWFEHAIPVLEKNDNVAGVAGIGTQEMHDTRMANRYVKYNKNLHFGEVSSFMGATLFKRYVLLDVGPFNPFLCAGEEGELCYRLIDRGYKLLTLPFHMTHHLGFEPILPLSLLKKQIRYTKSQGQIFRYSLNNNQIFWWRLKEYKFKIISLFLLFLGILYISIYFIFGIILPFYILLLISLFYLGYVFYEIRNLIGTVHYAASQVLKSIPFIWGFFQPKKNPEMYPTDVRIIK